MPKPNGTRTARRKLGRKTKLTATVRVSLVDSARNGLSQTAACAKAGISHNTLLIWRNKATDGDTQYIELFGEIERAEADFEQDLVNTVISAAKEPQVEVRIVEKLDAAGNVVERIREQRKTPPNWQAAFKALERLLPQRWGNRASLSVDLNANAKHTTIHRVEVDWGLAAKEMTDAELAALESAQEKLLTLMQGANAVQQDETKHPPKRAPRKPAVAEKNEPKQSKLL
jgi:hypothetical protein